MILLLLLLAAPAVGAQNRSLSGRVINRDTKDGIPGAIVSVVGARQAAQADEQGRFRITIPETEVTLLARSIGYKRTTIPAAAGLTSLEITLERDPLKLEEVVVTGEATTVARANAATAVTTVNSAELNRVPAPALENALQGKIVGARINMNSGAPGGGGQIQIRGVTTILGNGQPLYVVDGVVISNAQIQGGLNSLTNAAGRASIASTQDNATNRLADLNPNDIENVEVLKGAAASVLYGARATNGVIIITTKRGRAGAPRFDVTQRLGTFDAMRLVGHRRYQTREDAISAVVASGSSTATATRVVDSLVSANGGRIPFHDYQSDLYGHNDLAYETVASVSGGTEVTRYYASGTTKYDAGTQLNTGAKRDAVRFNLGHNLSTRLNFDVSATISRTRTDRGVSNNDNTFISPIYGFGYTPALIDLDRRDAQGIFVRNPFPAGGGINASNPFETLTYITNREDIWRGIGSGRLNYNAISTGSHTVTLNLVAGVDRFDQENNVYSPNFMQYEGNDGFRGRSVRGTGNSRQTNVGLNSVHTFTPNWAPLTSTLSAGVSSAHADLDVYRVQARGIIPGINEINQGTIQTFHDRQRIIDQSYYVQEEILAFNERLYIAGGFRADRSSANGDTKKFYYYPKGQASYSFVNPLSFVDRIKLRGMLGQSGNRPEYGVRDITLLNIGREGGLESIGANTTLGNPEVFPERMTEFELGTDLAIFHERAGLELTYFHRRITDLYLRAPLAPSSGLAEQIFNGKNSELGTQGWEIGLTLNPLRNFRGLDWTSRTSYYTVDSRANKLEVPRFLVGSTGFGTAFGRTRIAEGVSTTAIWGNIPFEQVGTSIRPLPEGCMADPVCAKRRAFSRDTIVADAQPDFEMGFGNDFSFRKLHVSVLVDWRKGGYVSNLTNNLFDEGETSRDYDTPCTRELCSALGDSLQGTTKLGSYRYNAWFGGADARIYVQNGTFVKLREVTLSYDLPDRWVNAVFFGRARTSRISLSGRNLAIWSDYWGSDPEVNNFGNQNVGRFVDLAPYPPARSFFFAIDVGF